MAIHFIDHQVKSNLKQKRKLKRLLANILLKESIEAKEINFIFCSDNYLLKINQRFLNHHFYTDTITFKYSTHPLLGDVYISVNRVKDNASNYIYEYNIELIRVIIHGLLHLCGYNDKRPIDKKRMVKKQEDYLRQWCVSRETN